MTEITVAALQLAFSTDAQANIAKVKIKEEKAGGVKDTLAKLKALQKGGKDGD